MSEQLSAYNNSKWLLVYATHDGFENGKIMNVCLLRNESYRELECTVGKT